MFSKKPPPATFCVPTIGRVVWPWLMVSAEAAEAVRATAATPASRVAIFMMISPSEVFEIPATETESALDLPWMVTNCKRLGQEKNRRSVVDFCISLLRRTQIAALYDQ